MMDKILKKSNFITKTEKEHMGISYLTSFKTLFQELYPDMVRLALFYVHDLPVAEDITQEVFARLWEKREKLDVIDNLKGYLSYAIKNHCLNHLEHLQVVNKYQQEYWRQIATEDHTDEFILKVQISLEKLPPKRRQILEMSIVEAKSYQEIADQEGISINTVKDHIKKAYAFLRKDIHRNTPDFILFIAFQTATSQQHKGALIESF